MATFSVNDQPRRVVNDGDGSTASFPFSFQVNATSDISVFVNAELRVEGTHYNIVNSSDAAGLNANGTGKVNFITTPADYTPANGAKVSIVSDVPVARSSVYTSGGNITAASLETDFDTLTMLVGDREEAISRSVQGPVSDPTTTSMVLPTKDGRKNKYLAFDAEGSVTCLAGTTAVLGSVESAQLVDDAVTTAKVADLAITAALLATNAVTSNKIANDAVTQAAIADDAVGTAQIADDAVVQAAIADGAVGTDQIADAAVTSAKFAAGLAFVSGMLMPFAGSSSPTGWLLAQGQSLSRTANNNQYADLFAAIGYTYGGSGDNFTLPDLRGRVVAGKGTGTTLTTPNQATLGATGGSKEHVLTEEQLASHTHAVNSVTVAGFRETSSGQNPTANALEHRVFSGNGSIQSTTGATIIGGSTVNHTASLANTGSGSGHNNVQPTLILNYIIKT